MDESVLEASRAATFTVVLAVRNQLASHGIENMLASVPLVSDRHVYHDIESAAAGINAGVAGPRADAIVLVVALSEVDEPAADQMRSLAERGVKILVMIDDVDRKMLSLLAEVAGSGFVFADEMEAGLLQRTLQGMQRGEMPVPARLTRLLLSAAGDGGGSARPNEVRMTPREREVLTLLVEGLSNKQIARRLGISEHGAKRHVANILAKLNCPNRTLAVAKALRDGHHVPQPPR